MSAYHMRRSDRAITDTQEIQRILRDGKFAVISMTENNIPYIVTLSYGYDEENNSMYFHCAAEGRKISCISSNPEVCATVIEDNGYQYGECTHHFSSLVIRGKLEPVQDIGDKKHAFSVMLKHLESDPEKIIKRSLASDKAYMNVTVLRLKIESVTGKAGK